MQLNKKISIKTFIGELPSILNHNFELLETLFNKLYDDVNETIKAKNLNIEGTVKTNSVVTNNLTVIDGSKEITFADILKRIEDCEKKLK